ncbi:hypothetical protein [uncultured Tateyamaria sp.]|uniref:hypothetical protein n=1 Tax=uncultured Tateyamaria sp. TaxID=455651 RepID=UPI00261199F4|nr:hypothetical protein [uncultured Tateyamaria sp.]
MTTTVAGSDELGRGAFLFLLRQAAEKEFSLIVTVPSRGEHKAWAQSKILEAGLSQNSEEGNSIVFSKDGKKAKVILNQSSQPHLLNWAEDVVFMGKHSAHTRDGAFQADLESGVDSALEWRREDDWVELGLRDPERHSYAVGSGNRTIDFRAIPEEFLAPDSASGDQRVFRKRESILAAIDGGNFLSNGAPRGERLYIVGLDSVAFTFDYLVKKGTVQNATPEDAKAAIQEALSLKDNDRLVFVEQPSFHIDMSMTVSGDNEVVLSDTRALNALVNPDQELSDFDYNKSLLEDKVQAQLEEAGVRVEREPWAGPISTEFNLFNGEFVRSEDTGKSYFITNGLFGLDEETKTILTDEIEEFYDAVGVEVVLSDEATARALLCAGSGGIGCKTNGVNC